MSTVVFTIRDEPTEDGKSEIQAQMDFGEAGYTPDSLAHQLGRVIAEFYRRMLEATMESTSIEAFDVAGNAIPLTTDENGDLTPEV